MPTCQLESVFLLLTWAKLWGPCSLGAPPAPQRCPWGAAALTTHPVGPSETGLVAGGQGRCGHHASCGSPPASRGSPEYPLACMPSEALKPSRQGDCSSGRLPGSQALRACGGEGAGRKDPLPKGLGARRPSQAHPMLGGRKAGGEAGAGGEARVQRMGGQVGRGGWKRQGKKEGRQNRGGQRASGDRKGL